MARAFIGFCGVALVCGTVLAMPSARGAAQRDPTLVPVGLVGGPPQAVAEWETTAYVAVGWTIQIVDVGDAAHPVAVGQLPLGQIAFDLAVTRSGVLLVALGPNGLAAFDLADPAAPIPAGTLGATAAIRLVAADGDTGYVIDGISGPAELRVVAAARGAPLRELGHADADNAAAVAAADGYVFVATTRSTDNVVAFDARALAPPRSVASVTVPECSGGAPCMLAAAGQTVVALGNGTLVVLESSDDDLRRVGAVAVTVPTSRADLVLRDDFAYVLCGYGVCVFDLADPARPRDAGVSAPISAELLSSAAAGPLVGVRLGALTTVDVTRPASPTLGSEMPLLGYVSGPLAGTSDPAVLLAGIDDRLAVLEATDRAAPALAGLLDLQSELSSNNRVLQIDVRGEDALLAAGGFFDGAVVTMDVTEPRRPRVLGVVRTQGIPKGFTWDGRIAYVTEGFEGPPRTPPDITEVFDLTDPHSPRRLTTLPEAEGRLHLMGGNLVAAGESGVHVFDITAPDAPALVAHVALPVASSLAEGDLLFVTTTVIPRLVVLDMSEPRHPTQVGEVFGNFPALLTTVGSLLVLGSSTRTSVVDVTDPTAPRPAGNLALNASTVSSLNGVGGRLYASSRENGLWVLEPRSGDDLPTPTMTPLPTPTWTPTPAPPTLHAFLPVVHRWTGR